MTRDLGRQDNRELGERCVGAACFDRLERAERAIGCKQRWEDAPCGLESAKVCDSPEKGGSHGAQPGQEISDDAISVSSPCFRGEEYGRRLRADGAVSTLVHEQAILLELIGDRLQFARRNARKVSEQLEFRSELAVPADPLRQG